MLLNKRLLLSVYFCILAFAAGCRSTRTLDSVILNLESRNVVQAPASWSMSGFDGPKKRVSLSGGYRETIRNGERGWEEIKVFPVPSDTGDTAIRVSVSWLPDRTRVEERIWEKDVFFPDNDSVSSFSVGTDYLPLCSTDEKGMFSLYLVRPVFVVFAWPSPVKTEVFGLEVSSCYRIFQIRRHRANHVEHTILKEMIVEGKERALREAKDCYFSAYEEGN